MSFSMIHLTYRLARQGSLWKGLWVGQIMSDLSSSLTESVISARAPGKRLCLSDTTRQRCENPSVVAACATWASLSKWRSSSKWKFLGASTSTSSEENLRVPRRGQATAATVAFIPFFVFICLKPLPLSATPAGIFGTSYDAPHTPVPKPPRLCQLAQSIVPGHPGICPGSVHFPPILTMAYVGSSESCLLTAPVLGGSPKSLNSRLILKNWHPD